MKLTQKLTLAFLFVSLIVIGLAAGFVAVKITSEFNQYLQAQRQNEFAVAAKNYYTARLAWDGVDAYLREQRLLPPLGEVNPPPQPYVLVDASRTVLVASAPYVVGEKVKQGELDKGIPIESNGLVVGTVISTGGPLVRNPIDQRYIDQIKQALWISTAGGVVISLILGWLLSRSLTRPIRDLTAATRDLASGRAAPRVPVRSNDELGGLAASFNQMSADLEHANQARRQMTADIAHDLRNPLTVIGGYLESLQDGKLQPTPERFETMRAEVQHLQRLVEDLRTLSLADAGELALQRQPVAPLDLLRRVAAAYQPQAEGAGVRLVVEAEPDLKEIPLDPERMGQVLGNLVSNALRYTPEGGEIHLGARQAGGRLVLSVRDNGCGIAPEILPHIFERSYRGDPSRSGNESGLGLTIVKSIVEAHGGDIQVRSEGAGSEFLIRL